MGLSQQDTFWAGPRRERWWRGLTGSLTAGLVALTLAVLVAHLISRITGTEGPGREMILGHLTGSALVLTGQRLVDRRRGWATVLAGIAVFVLTCVVLWLFWWT